MERRYKGPCGRGILGLKDWSQLQVGVGINTTSPAKVNSSVEKPISCEIGGGSSINKDQVVGEKDDTYFLHGCQVCEKLPENENENLSVGDAVMAKYRYEANADSPLGGPELSMTAGDNLTVLGCNPSNNIWWVVKTSEGKVGYVPQSYLFKKPDVGKVTSLPWLADREKVVPITKLQLASYTKYKPTYEHAELKMSKEDEAKNYYCGICDKQLNGPKPYAAHMASKAHAEEVEVQNAYN